MANLSGMPNQYFPEIINGYDLKIVMSIDYCS